MRQYKTKLKASHCEAIVKMVDYMLRELTDASDDGQLLLSALAEISVMMKRRLIDVKKEYKITFSPVQAIGIRMMYVEFIEPNQKNRTNELSTRLMLMSNEIHKLYQK